MKKIFIIILFSFLAINLQAKMTTDTFTDQVTIVKATPDGVKIGFEVRAAFYKLKKTHPEYKKLKSKLEELQKTHKKLKITVKIPELEIQTVETEGL